MIKKYIHLTKPGIIGGNSITAVAGFLLASKGHFDWGLFLAMLAGLSLIMASACVFNNYVDREMDKQMKRTQERALVKGEIPLHHALLFGAALGLSGTLLLALFTNLLTLSLALTGFFIYVVLYTFSKYHTPHATLIGSFAGATPPVVGYCAVNPHLDAGALLLFALLTLWQMPHFFAITLYRAEEYAAANIPVLPLRRGVTATKIQMVLYIAIFTGVATLLTFYGYTGYAYLTVALLLGLTWLGLCLKGFKNTPYKLWARKLFLFSLIVVMGLSLMISLDVHPGR